MATVYFCFVVCKVCRLYEARALQYSGKTLLIMLLDFLLLSLRCKSLDILKKSDLAVCSFCFSVLGKQSSSRLSLTMRRFTYLYSTPLIWMDPSTRSKSAEAL